MSPVAKILAILLLLLVASQSAAAPQGATSPSTVPATNLENGDAVDVGRKNLRVFTDKDGLPQNAITAIVFDRQNYLWAGTKDGLVRYNGREWTVVDLPPETGSNWIRSMLLGQDGTLWVGTGNGGLLHLENGVWTHFDERDGLGAREIICLLETVSEDGEWSLLAGTNLGLWRLQGGAWRRETPLPDKPDAPINDLLETRSADGRRTLWVATVIDGIARFQDGSWTRFDRSAGLPADLVTCLLETTALDGHPRLIAGTFNQGMMIFDGTEWQPYEGAMAPSGSTIHCLEESRGTDGAPILWAGTGRGVDRIGNGRRVHIDAEQGLPLTAVWTIAPVRTAKGTLAVWIGTAGLGLVRWQLGGWTSFDVTEGDDPSSVYSILATSGQDGSDTVWFNAIDHGLTRFEDGRWTFMEGPPGLRDNTIWSLLEAPDETGASALWAGTNTSGLFRLKNGRWTLIGIDQGMPSHVVNSLYPTTADDGTPALWAGTGNGLVRLEHGEVRDPGPGLMLPDHRVRTLLETTEPDGTRTLWIGTDGGLAKFTRGETTIYDKFSGDAEGDLPNNDVTCLYLRRSETGARTLWVGTRAGAALLDLDAPEAAWSYLSTSSQPALPNNTIYRIVEDSRRRVYISTNKGVARLTPRTPTADDPSPFAIYTYTTEDGLPSNECNTGAMTVDESGRIWVGTIAGAAVFDPSHEVQDTTPSPLVVERAVLPELDRALVPGEELAYDENHLLFEFALLSHFRGDETRYRTQLVGLDEKPSEWTAEYRRDYISLPAGDYRLAVWGRDARGIVSGPVDVPFTIRRAPWFTWWAMLVYLMAAAGLGYGVYRGRVRTLRRHNEELEAGIQERTTQLAHTVEDLRASEHRALEANRAKSVFLANMSHELRTPLNAVLGFAQLMESEKDRSAADRESLGAILHSGEHLLNLINDVLSIAKIEAGKLALVEQSFDLFELLRVVREMVELRAEAKGLALEFVLDPDLPRVVRADEGKLRQVLVNLLGNAVKFTDEGGVTLEARWEEGRRDRDRVVFEVRDTGCGIAEQDLDRLFEAFVQTESGLRAQEGTGLGLVISRDFVRLMGGDITVESAVGEGTTFRFDVALGVVSRVDRRTRGRRTKVVGLEAGERRWRILVADDMLQNRLLLARLLEGTGFEVRSVSNGAEAVDAWRDWCPDLIWMDMRMPVVDGLEATRRIRAEEGGARACKIIALTASAFEHERANFLEAGCDDFVPKPFQTPTIFAKMGEHLGVRYVYETVEEGEAATADGGLAPGLSKSIPAEFAEPLKRALTVGDATAAMEIVERIRERDGALADDLAARVRGYEFDDLLEWMG